MPTIGSAYTANIAVCHVVVKIYFYTNGEKLQFLGIYKVNAQTESYVEGAKVQSDTGYCIS